MTIITNTKGIPFSIHLIGNKVLGLTIDIVKAKGHFFSSNEVFGTFISRIGLDALAADNYINKRRMHRHNNILNGTEEKESMTMYDATLKSFLFS